MGSTSAAGTGSVDEVLERMAARYTGLDVEREAIVSEGSGALVAPEASARRVVVRPEQWRDGYPERDSGRPAPRTSGVDGPIIMRAADIVAERVSWLWAGRVPVGMLTMLDGDPGLGKSLVTIDLAARVSRGDAMPFETDRADPAGVVLLSAEDAPAQTIRPRLGAAGADLERVVLLSGVRERGRERGVTVADLAPIESAVSEARARLVVIDPIMAYLGEADSHRDQDVRAVLAPLVALAARLACAIVVVRHLRKSAGPAIYSGGGSIGLIGAARSGMLIACDPDDQAQRVMAGTKANLGPPPESLSYRVVAGDDDVARVEWQGTSSYTADALLDRARTAGATDSALADAQRVILEALADGPLSADDLTAKATDAGIAKRTLDRARAKLRRTGRVTVSPDGYEGTWFWSAAAMAKSGARGMAKSGGDGESRDDSGTYDHGV